MTFKHSTTKHLSIFVALLLLAGTMASCNGAGNAADILATESETITQTETENESKEEASGGLTFFLLDDGTCAVSGIGTFTGSHLVIPAVSPDGNMVTAISASAFKNCNELVSVTIPAGVTYIGNDAFQYCRNLTTLTVDADNEEYHSAGNCIIETDTKTLILGCQSSVIPTDGSVTTIGTRAFYFCKDLTHITIPDSVTSIETEAFAYCNLQSISIPASVTSIGYDAFFLCRRLVEVINQSALDIQKGSGENGCVADYALEVHNGESKVDRRDGYLFYTVENVHYLFGYMGDETALTLPENYDGESYQIRDYAFEDCNHIEHVTLPDGITSISRYLFYGCDSLTTVSIPDSVTYIGDGSFAYCGRLTDVQIPAGITYLGNVAFQGCSNLRNMVIPDGVSVIQPSVFDGCIQLTSVAWHGGITRIAGQGFKDCIQLTSILFAGTKEQWEAIEKNEYWYQNTVACIVRCTDGDITVERIANEEK